MTEERQKLATDNMGLAVHLANRYRSIPCEFDEIVSAAYYGLVKAANTFNSESGNAFATYATRCIVNEILLLARFFKKHNVVKASLDEPVPGTEDLTLKDMIPMGFDGFDVCERKLDLQKNIKKLNERELQIVSLKILSPDKSQHAIGNEIGVAQSYVSRILRSSKRKMMGEVA